MRFDTTLNFGNFGGDLIPSQPKPKPCKDTAGINIEGGGEIEHKSSKRRTTAVTCLSKQYVLRRSYSEVNLLEALQYEKIKEGVTYLFITAGDVDGLSYLKIALNQARNLDYVLISSWAMAGEDIFQVKEWFNEGRIRKVDFYLSDVFAKNYRIELQMIKDFYEQHPEAGRFAIFVNHSKVVLAANEEQGFYYFAALSSNLNSNPRTENGTIVLDKGVFDWAKGYYDGINSFKV